MKIRQKFHILGQTLLVSNKKKFIRKTHAHDFKNRKIIKRVLEMRNRGTG